jgi:hypothetical protein
MKNTPNFFIVGGPKCGTTAMVEFLRTHPEVFICEPKEPNFLADNMPDLKFVDSEIEYLNLFKNAAKAKIIGDASIFYMFSKIAIKNIFDLNPDAKILVMLRNPLEMVPSFHQQILFTLDEDEKDFEKALEKESLRKENLHIPKHCRSTKLLHYSEIAKYGEQLENIYQFFPSEQVKILLFDDFKNNNRKCYLEVLKHLELDDDGRVDFPRINEAKKAKNKIINRIVNRPPKFAKTLAKFARRILNRPRLGILNTLDHMNRDKLDKKPISKKAKQKLIDIYISDIKKTEIILKTDLRFWVS